jgi:hypothetical protein
VACYAARYLAKMEMLGIILLVTDIWHKNPFYIFQLQIILYPCLMQIGVLRMLLFLVHLVTYHYLLLDLCLPFT